MCAPMCVLLFRQGQEMFTWLSRSSGWSDSNHKRCASLDAAAGCGGSDEDEAEALGAHRQSTKSKHVGEKERLEWRHVKH